MDNPGISGFSKFNFNKQLQDAIEAQGWPNPTPIQEKAIPLAKAGKDILGIAQTGTGKSAAFLIPLISKLHFPQGDHVRALIIAPTKELVTQLSLHFEALNINTGLRMACLIGGTGITSQLNQLKKGVDIVFATPGRFLELYDTGEWKLKDIRTLVIDEADRMMDMGFMPQIRKILEKIPSKRQNLLFSATFPEKVETLAEEFLEFPEKIEVTPQATPAETIKQVIYRTYNFQTKLNLLVSILKGLTEEDAALVFVKTKKHATEIGKYLKRKLITEVAFLHANKGTNTRSAAVESLHAGTIKILVTTDVASRGLDVARISMVINFDIPVQYEDYVHRIGRTGRAMREGKAISFVNAPDELHLSRVEKLIRMKIQKKPHTKSSRRFYGKSTIKRKKPTPISKAHFTIKRTATISGNQRRIRKKPSQNDRLLCPGLRNSHRRPENETDGLLIENIRLIHIAHMPRIFHYKKC
jgi:ATP-dependent RNA helicase RhlE